MLRIPMADHTRIARRSLLAGAGGLFLCGAGTSAPASLAALEADQALRLGVAVLDTGTGRMSGHRMGERFGLCSTFKLFLAGLVLQAADRGELKLGDALAIQESDIVPPSPVAGPFVGRSLSIEALAEGTQKTSDNAAANLLMRKLGGPYGVTQRLRALGDQVTRLDRYEPDMNLVIGDDPRDTSTPEAVATTTAQLVLGDVLAPATRAKLARWMEDTSTGLKRLRAGAPVGWRIGDKTGTGYGPGRPSRINDIAVAWPPHRAPLVVAAYLEMPTAEDFVAAHEAVLAHAMRIAMLPYVQA